MTESVAASSSDGFGLCDSFHPYYSGTFGISGQGSDRVN